MKERTVVILVIGIIGSLVIFSFNDDIRDWFENSEDEKSPADLPIWEPGYTWVYEETWDPEGGRFWTFVDYISGTETIGGRECYVRSSLERNHLTRFERVDDSYHAVTSLNGMDETVGLPNFLDYDFPLSVGKTWTNVNTAEEFSGMYEVSFQKDVRTGAGTFDCFKISGTLVKYDDDATIYQNRTFYYSPEVKKEVLSLVVVDAYDSSGHQQWVSESELAAFGHADSDHDRIADRVEEEILGTEPLNEDTDGDGTNDERDLIPTIDMHLRLVIYEFETADNDEYDNGLNPSECDPYFIIELRGASGGNDVFASYETEHFTDRNRVENIEIVFDLVDDQEYVEYGNFEKIFYVDIMAYDDDSSDSTDTNGDDDVNINDNNNDYVCINTMFILDGEIKNNDDNGQVKEGETLYDSGSDSNQVGDETKGGEISYTFEIVDRP